MKNLNLVLRGTQKMTKEQMKNVVGGETTAATVLCLCDGGRAAGYCICSSGSECVECCEVACSE